MNRLDIEENKLKEQRKDVDEKSMKFVKKKSKIILKEIEKVFLDLIEKGCINNYTHIHGCIDRNRELTYYISLKDKYEEAYSKLKSGYGIHHLNSFPWEKAQDMHAMNFYLYVFDDGIQIVTDIKKYDVHRYYYRYFLSEDRNVKFELNLKYREFILDKRFLFFKYRKINMNYIIGEYLHEFSEEIFNFIEYVNKTFEARFGGDM